MKASEDNASTNSKCTVWCTAQVNQTIPAFFNCKYSPAITTPDTLNTSEGVTLCVPAGNRGKWNFTAANSVPLQITYLEMICFESILRPNIQYFTFSLSSNVENLHVRIFLCFSVTNFEIILWLDGNRWRRFLHLLSSLSESFVFIHS